MLQVKFNLLKVHLDAFKSQPCSSKFLEGAGGKKAFCKKNEGILAKASAS
jgi:hypothetical protein